MQIAPWQEAIDKQLRGIAALQMLIDHAPPLGRKMERQWRLDHELLTHAKPYDWGDEPIEACLRAMQSIPLDTAFNLWNTGCSGSAWWYLSKPLPYKTVTGPEPIRALSFGWVAKLPKRHFKAGVELQEIENAIIDQQAVERKLCISAWIDDKRLGIAPTQLFYWSDGETIGEMLDRVRQEHLEIYGPGGTFEKREQIGIDHFMEASEGIARFILGGLAWLRQRVVVETPEKIERHRRKEYVKKTGQIKEEPRVRVISLRRVERKPTEQEAAGGEKREYSCRFMVGLDTGGFFRNQACGPKHGDRRLVFIAPFMKGPEDAPLRIPPTRKVFLVNR